MEYIYQLPESLYAIGGVALPIAWTLIKAFIILIVGLVVASGISSLIERIIKFIKLDNLIRNSGMSAFIERGGLNVNSGKFFGAIIYWFIIVIFVWTIVKQLELEGLAQFLEEVVNYVPNIIIAAVMLIATFIAGNFLKNLTRSSAKSAQFRSSNFLGALVWWVTILFGLISALIQLGIAPALLNTIITGLVAMIALGGGIAIGLGGKDYAGHLINKLREHTE